MANRKTKRERYKERVFGKVGELDLVTVSPTDEYLINGRGGKVYLDIEKHSYLDIPNSISGKMYEVLSVGTHQQSNKSLVTVKAGDLIQVYRLPDDLQEWVILLGAQSAMGIKLLPSKVQFGTRDSGEHYAEIL
ncbi:hypothetical protein D3C71_1578490 [compost metagenome]